MWTTCIQTLATSLPISSSQIYGHYPLKDSLVHPHFHVHGFYEIQLSIHIVSASMPILPNNWQLKGVSPCWVQTMPTGACGPWPRGSAFHIGIDGTFCVQNHSKSLRTNLTIATLRISQCLWDVGNWPLTAIRIAMKKDRTNSNFWCITKDTQFQRWVIVSQYIVCV